MLWKNVVNKSRNTVYYTFYLLRDDGCKCSWSFLKLEIKIFELVCYHQWEDQIFFIWIITNYPKTNSEEEVEKFLFPTSHSVK